MNFSQNDILFHISPSFFAYIYVFSYMNSSNVASEILFAMLMHELGHIFAIYLLGKKISEIFMGILGVRISIHRTMVEQPFTELVISSAGIFVNFIIAICLFRLNPSLSSANLAVAIFNSIPAIGLDGDRILENFLMCIFHEPNSYKLQRVTSITICSVIAFVVIAYNILYEFKIAMLLIALYCIYSIVVQIFYYR